MPLPGRLPPGRRRGIQTRIPWTWWSSAGWTEKPGYWCRRTRGLKPWRSCWSVRTAHTRTKAWRTVRGISWSITMCCGGRLRRREGTPRKECFGINGSRF
jgi:hypothetical protein